MSNTKDKQKAIRWAELENCKDKDKLTDLVYEHRYDNTTIDWLEYNLKTLISSNDAYILDILHIHKIRYDDIVKLIDIIYENT